MSKDAMSGRSRSERRKVLYASHMMRSAITIAPAVLAIWTFSSLARVSREQGGGAEVVFGEDGSVTRAHHVGGDLLQVDSCDDRHAGLRDVLEQGRRPADPLLELQCSKSRLLPSAVPRHAKKKTRYPTVLV